MLARMPKKTARTRPPQASRFLNARIAPSRVAADSEHGNAAFV